MPDLIGASFNVATADDQALVDAFRGGDVGSFEELYRRHQPLVQRRLTRLAGNAAVAEELTQETFLRAAQRIGSTGGELHFRAWVLRIATNIGIDHLRALKRTPAQSLDDMVNVVPAAGTPTVVDTEASVEMRENARFVASVLDRLNPRHRTVLVMREIEGLDYRSIAEREEYAKAIAE